MKLDRVTITGADDGTAPSALAALSVEFPFVEWGILVSDSNDGRERFPSRKWVDELLDVAEPAVRLSLHVCGSWVRWLLLGHDTTLTLWGGASGFQRIQLNTHGQPHEARMVDVARMVRRRFASQQLIVQMDGTDNERLLGQLRRRGVDAVPLFDTSAGAGLVPVTWPKPVWTADGDDFYHGYAGGLGPDNVARELKRIAAAAGDARIWIDMEGRVRSDDGHDLDLVKVRRVLEICAPYVTAAAVGGS